MSKKREELILELKRLREDISKGNISNVKNLNNFLDKKEDNNGDTFGKSKTKVLTNGSIRAYDDYLENYKQGGYIDAILLGIFTFVCEALFILISYTIFK